MKEKVAIIGGGAWGSALACVAVRAGNEVAIFLRDPAIAAEINTQRTNAKYLPGINLDPSFAAMTDLDAALPDADIVLLATPAQAIGAAARLLKGRSGQSAIIVCCAKGIDRTTGKLPAELVAEALPQAQIAALSGPSFATDVARGLPTAVTVASRDLALSAWLAQRLSAPAFRCYASDDLKGVELGGALKNVLALAVGAARAMRLGASAEAALIARGFAELTRLAEALGARTETLSGLSGLGDLVLTCSSPQSRNFSYGVALGSGASLDHRPLAEGVHTARIASDLAKRRNIDVPVINAVADVLDKRLTAGEAVAALLDRPLKAEGKQELLTR